MSTSGRRVWPNNRPVAGASVEVYRVSPDSGERIGGAIDLLGDLRLGGLQGVEVRADMPGRAGVLERVAGRA